MIRNNLALLMTQKRRRVNELANDTGISRNTITSTAQNKGKMIQLSTINKLCQSLEVDPTAFFEYVPFDFDYTFDEGDLVPDADYDHGKPETYEASLFINVSENNNRIDSIELQGYIDFEGQYDGDTIMIGTDLHPSDTSQLKKLNSYLGKMSVSFISDIKRDIEEVVGSALNENSNVKVHPDLLIDFEETKEQYFTKLKNRNSNH
ncbi:helix-turn-helix domain-containing protein [Levilactobacillus brevis]|uniref:helix-turn-helix domain-containing protein n=1 Tax=Levilactobacillus brevis TaxID=1580 RepID=UPI0018C11751|nr:helix-turn-helix domain-containing protein [Levilactobacillus brevis]QOX66727.1 helix-turn-helix domain-containing protein [Levilactobacillus brevis]